MHDFLRRSDRVFRRQAVQHAELVVGAEETPGVALRAILFERERGEGRRFVSHIWV